MSILLLAEHSGGALKNATFKALTAAQQIGGAVHMLVAGQQLADVAAQAARLSGVEKVLVADDASLAHQLAEPLAVLLVQLAAGYDVLMAPSTSTGKNVMPRVAALLDVMQISDVTKVVAADCFERPIYAGNAVQVVRALDAKKVLTVRTASFAPAVDGGSAVVEAVAVRAVSVPSRFVSEELSQSSRPELGAAKIIVSGGRALGSAEQFQAVLEPLADQLKAAIGASRAAVDAGYAPNDAQVGQTGKVVAPDLYIAVGISGAIQHLAGMKDSKVIVAINKDEEAPIFQVADYGIVGDLFCILPQLREELTKAGY